MTIKTKLFSLFLFVFISPVLFAQNTIDYVPKDATIVMTMNPKNLDQKVGIEQLTQLSFFQDMMSGMTNGLSGMDNMKDVLSSPSKYGMDFMSNSYMVAKVGEEGSFFSYIFKLADAQKAGDFFKAQSSDETDMLGRSTTLMQANGFQYLDMADGGTLAWNNNVGMMISGNVEYEYVEYSMEEFDAADSLNRVAILDYMTESMQVPSNSIKEDARFMADSKNSDGHLWLDYEYIQSLNKDRMPEELSAYGLDMLYDQMMSLYDGSKMSVNMNFDKGAMNMDTKTYMNPELQKMWSATMDSKMNKKLHKYIKGKDMMGYFSFNYNVENSVEATKGMVYNMMNDIPMVGGMANSAMDILGIFIDEEAIYNLLKGDMIFAVTGMQEFDTEVISYEYDEDFNQTEVKKKSKQTLPEFTMAMSYGNKDDMMKFVRLAEQFGVIQSIGKYFKINSDELPMDTYMALNNGIMLLTNDVELVGKRLDSGYPKSQRMSKKHCKILKNSSTTFFWDIPQTLDASEQLGMPMDFSSNKMMKMSKDTFESMLFTSNKTIVNNVSTGRFSFNMGNKQQNSLEQFFNFINDIYISEMGGRSM